MSPEGGRKMGIKQHTPEQIMFKLRKADVALAQGQHVQKVIHQLGVTEQTNYR